MTKQEAVDFLLSPGIIAIVRSRSSASLADVAEALYAGGVRAIEATMTTPGATESVRSVRPEIKSKMAVGVGTVLTVEAAQDAVGAGAAFIVSPVVRLDVVAACVEMGVPIACGAFTPTEALAAHEAGADFVKIFPADVGGPAYIKSLLAPLPFLRIIPTGGVTPETCGAFMKAGCVALGAGTKLVSDDILESGDWGRLTERARAFVDAVRTAASH